jgi:6-phosphogluconolactonase (cycloisomerase 2 family)
MLVGTAGIVESLTVNAATGHLRFLGQTWVPPVIGPSDRFVGGAVTPSGRFAYFVRSQALNASPVSVSAFAIDGASGALTPLPGSPFSPAPGPVGDASDFGAAVAVDASGKHLYVGGNKRIVALDGSDATVYVFAFDIDSATGTLTEMPGSPFIGAPGTNGSRNLSPISMSMDLSGRYLYAVNGGGNNISAFSVNGATGALTPVDCDLATPPLDSCVVTGNSLKDGEIGPLVNVLHVVARGADPTGRNLFAYSIDPASGALVPLVGTLPNGGANRLPVGVDFHPSGKFAYVVNSTGSVSTLGVDPATGVLTAQLGPVTAASIDPSLVQVDPSGEFLYVGDATEGVVSSFDIDGATGLLSNRRDIVSYPPVSLSIVAGTAPATRVPAHAYIANQDSGTVSAFDIDAASGALAPVPGSPFAVAPAPATITTYGSDRFALIGPNNGVFALDPATGALVAPTASGVGPTTGVPLIEATGRFAYKPNSGVNAVLDYSVSPATGALSRLSAFYEIDQGLFEQNFVAADPIGNLYVSHGVLIGSQNVQNVLTAFSINPVTGVLQNGVGTPCPTGSSGGGTPPPCYGTGTNPVFIAIEPTGQRLYTVNKDAGTLSMFRISHVIPNIGVLSPIAPGSVAAGQNPTSMAIDPFGRFAWVANSGSGSISAYGISQATGQLTPFGCATGSTTAPIDTCPAGTEPVSVAADPSGTFLFAVDRTNAEVHSFRINANGTLTVAMAPVPTGGASPVWIAITESVQ